MNNWRKAQGSGFKVWRAAAALALLAALAVSAPAAEPQVRELTLAECVGLALENNLDL